MKNQLKIQQLIERIVANVPAEQLTHGIEGLDVNEADLHNRTPLMVAAQVGSLDAVKMLLRMGALPEIRGYLGVTALHVAAVHGQVEVMRHLLSVGADIAGEADLGTTPLMCAAAWGNVDAVKLLLEHHADATKLDARGGTAADGAYEKGEDEAGDVITAFLQGCNQA